MLRNFVFAIAALTLGTVAASADTFTFNADFCSNPCLGGVPASNNGGTVSVTQTSTNIVDVSVTLNNLLFHDQGLESFAFNITGDPALTLVTGTLANDNIKIINAGGTTWTLAQPAGNTDGAGSTFDYALNCAGGAGACTGSNGTLEFQIDITGLTPASLETKTGSGGSTTNVDFAANVSANGGACTGMIGAGNGANASTPVTTNSGTGTPCTPASGTPEPTSVLLFGSVLAFVGRVVKTRLVV